MSIHMATDRPLPTLLLFCNEWRSSLICCLVHSGWISLCSNSCMKFRRGHLGCNTAGAAVLLVPFSGLKEKGARMFSRLTVLTVKPQGRCRNTLQIKSLEPRACTVSSSLLGRLPWGPVYKESVKISSLMRGPVLSCPQAWSTGDSQCTCTFGSVWYRNMAAFRDCAFLHCAGTGQFFGSAGVLLWLSFL